MQRVPTQPTGLAAIPPPADPTLQPTTFLRANYHPIPMRDLPLRIKQGQVVGKRPGLINQDPEDFIAASVLQLTESERRTRLPQQADHAAQGPLYGDHQKHLSIMGWNPGGRRKRETNIAQQLMGPWHIILVEECHGLIELRHHQNFHIATYDELGLAILARRTTFSSMQVHYEHFLPEGKGWGAVTLMARLTFLRAWPSARGDADAITSITVASTHLHNIAAKKAVVASSLLGQLTSSWARNSVDIIHGDFNMAVSKGYLRDALPASDYIWPSLADHMWGMPKAIGDCCGFLIRRWTFAADSLVSRHGTWDFDYHQILGISAQDTGSHYMNYIHFNPTALGRPELRSAPATNRRMEKKKTMGDRKRAKKEEARQNAASQAASSSTGP
jgi:hypothetical protein